MSVQFYFLDFLVPSVVQLVEVVYRVVFCSMFQVNNSLWFIDIILFIQLSDHQGI